jgi:hypothetical protein
MALNYDCTDDLTDRLPMEVANKGCQLIYEPPNRSPGDPVYLDDRHSRELFRWDYVPSLGEVWDKCRELKLME